MSFYSDYVLSLSPDAYWRMDDASGNPQDLSGNARHMTSAVNLHYHESSPLWDGGDLSSYSMRGDGDGWSGQVSATWINPNYNEDFWGCFWFWGNYTTASYYNMLFTKCSSPDTVFPFAVFLMPYGYPRFSKGDGSHFPAVQQNTNYADSQWHFLAFKKYGSEWGMKLDTNSALTTTDTTTTTTTNARDLRTHVQYDGNFFVGYMTEIVYKKGSMSGWEPFNNLYGLGKGYFTPSHKDIRRPTSCITSYHLPKIAQ